VIRATTLIPSQDKYNSHMAPRAPPIEVTKSIFSGALLAAFTRCKGGKKCILKKM
jgi:hypothetical protein